MSHSTNSQALTIPVLDSVTPDQVQKAIATCERLLTEGNPIPLRLSREWARRFPKEAGVYAVSEKGTLIYVGETGSLSARMTDFLDSRNHVLRRNIGNKVLAGQEGFSPATAHERFPDHIETLLDKHIEDHLAVLAVVVPLGRKEIEEHMSAKYHPEYNHKGKRGSRLHGGGSQSGRSE